VLLLDRRGRPSIFFRGAITVDLEIGEVVASVEEDTGGALLRAAASSPWMLKITLSRANTPILISSVFTISEATEVEYVNGFPADTQNDSGIAQKWKFRAEATNSGDEGDPWLTGKSRSLKRRAVKVYQDEGLKSHTRVSRRISLDSNNRFSPGAHEDHHSREQVGAGVILVGDVARAPCSDAAYPRPSATWFVQASLSSCTWRADLLCDPWR
jgi:hypothetical protein